MKTHEIYRGVILDHARHPRNRGILDQPDLKASANNPLCGDELVLSLRLEADRISECRIQVRGSSICQASASMMSEQLVGKSLTEASSLSETFQSCLKQLEGETPLELENLFPLIILKAHRSRIKCVILAWNALDECAAQNRDSTTKPATPS